MMLNAMKRPLPPVWVKATAVLFVLLLTPAIATAAQPSKTIENVPPWPHLAPVGTSPDWLVTVITAAAEYQGWRIIGEAPGVVTAILMRRTHEAVVTIGYDEMNFWINYKDSKNLNYSPKDLKRYRHRERYVFTKGPRIHPNYNRWVAELADQIALQMQMQILPKRSNENPPERSNPSPLLVADELDKLDKLRQRGVLTPGEFDQQKAKLLAR